MARKKKYDLGVGNYYMSIKNYPNNILLHRKTKKAAQDAYSRYNQVGKDIEWLGKWDGEGFVEDVT